MVKILSSVLKLSFLFAGWGCNIGMEYFITLSFCTLWLVSYGELGLAFVNSLTIHVNSWISPLLLLVQLLSWCYKSRHINHGNIHDRIFRNWMQHYSFVFPLIHSGFLSDNFPIHPSIAYIAMRSGHLFGNIKERQCDHGDILVSAMLSCK